MGKNLPVEGKRDKDFKYGAYNYIYSIFTLYMIYVWNMYHKC